MTENDQYTSDTERLRKLVQTQEEIIEYQRKTIEELERQRELILAAGEFPDELEQLYADHYVHTGTDNE